ncbi:MAG: glycosyltransferase family 4 protein [Acidobacteriota bacterium]
MKILILSQYYPPEPGSSAMRMSEMAETLASRKHKVTVITGFPNYPEGKIYKGYRGKLFSKEEIQGVTIYRTFVLTLFRNKKFVSRLGNYLSFMITSIFGGLAAGKHDLIYFYSPPIFLGVSAFLLSRLYGIPYVFELNDLWPRAPIALGVLRNKILIRVSESLEGFVYRKASKIFFYSNKMRQAILDMGIPPANTEIHYLWVDTHFFSPLKDSQILLLREQYGLKDKFVILYAGNIGIAQGIGTVIESARLLKDQKEIVFMLVGGGSERDALMERARNYQLENVLFVPQQPVSEMPGMMSASDALIVHLDRAPHRLGTIPAKTLAYMSCGRPVLMAAEGESADLIIKSRSGIIVPPQNPEKMAEAVRQLYENRETSRQMGKAGRDYAIDHFHQAKILDEIEESFQKIIREASEV